MAEKLCKANPSLEVVAHNLLHRRGWARKIGSQLSKRHRVMGMSCDLAAFPASSMSLRYIERVLSLWVSGNLDQCEMKEVNKLWLGQCYLSHPIAIGSLLVQLKSPKILNKNGTASQSQVEDSVQCVGLEIEKQRAQLSEKLCFQPFTTFRIATLLQTLRNWPGEGGGW